MTRWFDSWPICSYAILNEIKLRDKAISYHKNLITIFLNSLINRVTNTNTRTTMTTSAAIAAAKLKREKKATAIKAQIDGKIAAAERRELEEQQFRDMADKEHHALREKIASARKAMGVRKNEDTPASLRSVICQWENEMMLRFWKHKMLVHTKM